MRHSTPRQNKHIVASFKSLNRNTNTQTVTHDKHTPPSFFSHSESNQTPAVCLQTALAGGASGLSLLTVSQSAVVLALTSL